jgi:hypothetical protein
MRVEGRPQLYVTLGTPRCVALLLHESRHAAWRDSLCHVRCDLLFLTPLWTLVASYHVA